jgi:hypothetical protein
METQGGGNKLFTYSLLLEFGRGAQTFTCICCVFYFMTVIVSLVSCDSCYSVVPSSYTPPLFSFSHAYGRIRFLMSSFINYARFFVRILG